MPCCLGDLEFFSLLSAGITGVYHHTYFTQCWGTEPRTVVHVRQAFYQYLSPDLAGALSPAPRLAILKNVLFLSMITMLFNSCRVQVCPVEFCILWHPPSQPLLNTSLLSASLNPTCLDSTHKKDHLVFVFLCLAHLTQCLPGLTILQKITRFPFY